MTKRKSIEIIFQFGHSVEDFDNILQEINENN